MSGGGFRGINLAHNVRSRDDVDAVVAAAGAAGATVTRSPADTFYGGYAGHFADPRRAPPGRLPTTPTTLSVTTAASSSRSSAGRGSRSEAGFDSRVRRVRPQAAGESRRAHRLPLERVGGASGGWRRDAGRDRPRMGGPTLRPCLHDVPARPRRSRPRVLSSSSTTRAFSDPGHGRGLRGTTSHSCPADP